LKADLEMAKSRVEQDVVIVGAGAAGIGIAHVFKTLGLTRFQVLERHQIGESFLRWPKEMKFITPSFTSNAFGLPDLNAVTMDTSPAYTLEAEHPSGPQYAAYLEAIVEEYKLPVKTSVEVQSISRSTDSEEGFDVTTNQGVVRTKFVVWAAGEFQYPRIPPITGRELGQHSSLVESWDDIKGRSVVVIGGYESGIDAAYHLSALGKNVTVVDVQNHWKATGPDPSQSLSPYTAERLRIAQATGRLKLIDKFRVKAITRVGKRFEVIGRRGVRPTTVTATAPPIFATGFVSSLALVEDLFARDEQGGLLLSPCDESTSTAGLFLCGPMVKHDAILMCFIYKFRQRFAVVAKAIADRLGIESQPLEIYRTKQMFLDDLSCCLDDCAC
jgi:putative flavoprotein involved in K+ transport